MANNFSAIRVKQLAASVVGALKANHVFGQVVTKGRDIDPTFTSGDRFAKKGDTMVVEIEPTLVATVHDPSGNSAQDVVSTAADIVLNTILTVDLDISSLDLSTMREESILRLGKSAATALDKKLDQLIKDEAMKTQYYHSQIASATKKDLLALIQIANSNLVPTSERTVVMDVATFTNVLGIDAFLDADKRGDGGLAFREALAGRALGCDFLLDQNCLTEQTPTDTALAVNNGAGYSAGDTSIVFDGGSSSNLAAGDMVKFAGETGTPYHTVSSVTFGVAGVSGTLVIADGLVSSIVDDAVITVKSPSQSVLVQKEGLAFGIRPLRPFSDGTSTTMVTPDGYSVRAYFSKDGSKKTEQMTFDMLVGIVTVDEKRVIRYPSIA